LHNLRNLCTSARSSELCSPVIGRTTGTTLARASSAKAPESFARRAPTGAQEALVLHAELMPLHVELMPLHVEPLVLQPKHLSESVEPLLPQKRANF